ncbi:MAG: hypothetical protein GX591_12155 [Planctomycetes bacterium]|nr:hypothetical protein [Planctomycetota bacterium]
MSPPGARTDPPIDVGAAVIDAVGPYAPDRIDVAWTDEPRPTSDALERHIAAVWLRRTGGGERLWNGPLCRLVAWSARTDQLTLTVGPTDYRAFLGTNLCGPDFHGGPGGARAADPVGVSVLVRSADRRIVLGRRGARVAYNAGRVHPIGGCMEPPGPPSPPNPAATVLAELREELAVDGRRVGGMRCLGMAHDKFIAQPELIFEVETACPADVLRRRRRTAADAAEHTDLFVADDDGDVLERLLAAGRTDFSPIAVAALLLHGHLHWGDRWLASAVRHVGPAGAGRSDKGRR